MNERSVDHDLETARMVRHWLERTARELPDHPSGQERLLDLADRAEQRSSWWLPPVFPEGVGAMLLVTRLTAIAGIVVLFASVLLMGFTDRDEASSVAPAGTTASPSAPASEPPAVDTFFTCTVTHARTL